jgi:G3E family GTPase
MKQKKVPFVLITGFLGSGKTTLLKRIIHTYANDMSLGIIQNEFAPGSVDAVELRSEDDQFLMLEINNGSVFCVCLLDSFVGSASAFLDTHNPDIVLMEASGLSDPVGIAELMQAGPLSERCYLQKIVCVVDGANFQRMIRVSRQLQRQVMIADHVLINKSDKADRTNLDEVREMVVKLNPHVRIDEVVHCDISIQEVLEPNGNVPAAFRVWSGGSHPEPSGRPDVGVGVIKSSRQIHRSDLRLLLDEYVPLTYRIKGFVKLSEGVHVSVQTSFDAVSIEEIRGYAGPTELVAIGEDFDFRRFARKFRELSEHYGAKRISV